MRFSTISRASTGNLHPINQFKIKNAIPRFIIFETNPNYNMKKFFFIFTILTICTLSCQTGKEASTAGKDMPLYETQWILTDIDGQPIGEAPAKPFIIFSNDGKVSGNLGCNEFFGNCFVKKDKISIEYKGSTKKLCNKMETERAFTSALKKEISNYTITGDMLILRTKDQEVLRFKAAPKTE